jgi:hypothetical protein
MYDFDLALTLRNALLLQLLVILMLPDHAAVAVHRHMQRAWRRIQAPLLEKRQPPRNGSRFWEIDLTKFEP